MKLQNLTVIFIIIILPIILLTSLYISTGIKTITYQALYDDSLLNATRDAVYAFEQNSINNKYSNNAETKRSIIKSSVKMFQTSLATGCNISTYDSKEIDTYIPALVFGMYDGFYMYAPTLKEKEIDGRMVNVYEKDLKSYVYYSETLDDDTVIRYSLDNYVSVTTQIGSNYVIKEGYLIVIDTDNGVHKDGSNITYKKHIIDSENIDANGDGITELNEDARKYYEEAKEFTEWFLNVAKMHDKKKNGVKATYLEINSRNDPENPESAFVMHKQKVIREKMQAVLNSTITAYSNRTWGTNYKMPKLSEKDWEMIYNNISMISFFQGKQIGFTKYNGYCVLNSTNNKEYVNPNLMYFSDEQGKDGWYHDIRCTSDEFKNASELIGYRIGSFEHRKEIEEKIEEDPPGSGNKILRQEINYVYDHKELACYYCINGNEKINSEKSVYEYIHGTTGNVGKDYADDKVKKAYWTSLARERYNTTKLTK